MLHVLMWRDRGLRVTSQAAGHEVDLTERREEENEKSPDGETNNDEREKKLIVATSQSDQRKDQNGCRLFCPITQQKRQQLTVQS